MFLKDKSLDGQVCLITGASRGIGAVIARALANKGANLVLNYCSSELEALRLARELRETGVQVLAVKADVGRESDVERMFNRIESELGNVNIMVYNAGVSLRALLTDTSEEQWNRLMDTNLKGAFLCCRRVLPNMISQHYGRIVNIASVWGISGAAFESVYAASKGGLISLTKSLAREVGRSGITVNAIAPGPIMTEMLQKELDDEETAVLIDEIPAGRLGTPEDIASACVYLLSLEASFINGHILSIDGGWKV